MGLELLGGDLAIERMLDAFDRVASLLSYLRAGVEIDGPTVQAGQLPSDGERISCQALLSDPDWLEDVMDLTGRRLGTEDPVVGASLFVQNYSYRVLTIAIACLTTSGVVPDSSASSMAVSITGGRPSTVSYTRPKAIIVSEPGPGVLLALNDLAIVAATFEPFILASIEEHVALLIDSVRSRIRIGERLLWGNVAASAAVAFRTMEGCLGPWIQPLAEEFFRLCPAELKGLGSFLALEHAGRRGWYWERTNCCLYDRLPGNVRCSDCSRTPTDRRRSGYLETLMSQ